MNKATAKRQDMIIQMSEYILYHSLQAATLKQLAAAAGTSDRMLLHYFQDKDDIIRETLDHIVKDLLQILEQSRPPQLPLAPLLTYLHGAMQTPEIRPYLRLWMELMALATTDEALYASIARQISQQFATWIAEVLLVPSEQDRPALSSLVLTLVEGFLLLDTLGDATAIQQALHAITAMQTS